MNKKILLIGLPILAAVIIILVLVFFYGSKVSDRLGNKTVLPKPKMESNTSVEKALKNRRSVRNFKEEALSMDEVSQILWSAQGISDGRSKRTAPSAGSTYPLELYIVVKNVTGLEPGLYRFVPKGHTLQKILEGDINSDLKETTSKQSFVEVAPINLVFTAIYERTAGRYGDKAKRYVHMEVGHAAQNVYLQVESLGLGTVVVGAFDEDKVKELLGLPNNEVPLYIMPVGKK